jgi:hypothetical protein
MMPTGFVGPMDRQQHGHLTPGRAADGAARPTTSGTMGPAA